MTPHWKLAPQQAWLWLSLCAIGLAAIRAVGMLGPAALRPIVPLGFVLMTLLPFVLQTGTGRHAAGFCAPNTRRAWFSALLAGAAAALLCWALGMLLFGNSPNNWFVSVAGYYRRVLPPGPHSQFATFLILTIPAILFSPIGEEVFFRGVWPLALAERFGKRVATAIECGFFGIVHLCHHGLWRDASGAWQMHASAPLWVVLMMATAWLFARIRQGSGSLYPAMLAHAGFNLVMNLMIFATLWP